ncbi:O-antigen ligase family protein [Alkalibacterium sp. MB6]|uniref:O-antigen ligase family protein n=1 Tax=Alkalibacterium sp. MB6 TaxID=2081965 RepID=UPI00137B290C|nr:O-antigen ligase family protein [Alkalibacterium sp. MB6]
MKKLGYLLIASVFLGTDILAVNAGIAQVSMYRMLLALCVITISFIYIRRDPAVSLRFNLQDNQFRYVYLIWLIIGVFSFIWARDSGNWMKGIFFVGVGTFTIVLTSTLMTSQRDLKKCFVILFSMIGFHQLMGLYEIMTNHYIWADLSGPVRANFSANSGARVPYTTFTNINDYSTLIFASIPLSCIILFNTNKKWLKGLSILSILSTLFLLYRTGSRGNQLALILFVFTLFILKTMKRRYLRVILYSICIFMVLFIGAYFAVPSLRYSIYSVVIAFIRQSGSNVYRINLLLNGFAFLAQSFGFGVGAGNIETWMVESPIFVVDAPNIHNWFMDILVAYGLITFILYTLMYLYILRQLYVSYKYSYNPFIRSSSFFLFAYVISFVASSISSASNIFIEWQWVLWAVIIAFVQLTEKKESENNIIKKGNPTISNVY